MWVADSVSTVTAAANNPFTYITGLGFPGVIIGLFMSGQLRTKSEVDRMQADLDRQNVVIAEKDDQIIKLQTGIVEQAIPAIAKSTQVLETIPITESATLREVQALHYELQAQTTLLNERLAGRIRRRW